MLSDLGSSSLADPIAPGRPNSAPRSRRPPIRVRVLSDAWASPGRLRLPLESPSANGSPPPIRPPSYTMNPTKSTGAGGNASDAGRCRGGVRAWPVGSLGAGRSSRSNYVPQRPVGAPGDPAHSERPARRCGGNDPGRVDEDRRQGGQHAGDERWLRNTWSPST